MINIYTHVAPDADAFGSALGLSEILNRGDPDDESTSTVWVRKEDWENRPASIRALASKNAALAFFEDGDPAPEGVNWAVDCGDLGRVSCPASVREKGFKESFDHHCNEKFADVEYGGPRFPAAAAVVAQWVRIRGLGQTPESATALFAGLYGDTCGFTVNTGSHLTFATAAALVGGCADTDLVIEAATRQTLPRARLFAKVVDSIESHTLGGDEKFLLTCVTKEDFEKVGATKADYAGVPSQVLRIGSNTVLAVCLCQDFDTPTTWRVAFRTKGWSKVKAKDLAQMFGGNGHPDAAGGVVEGATREQALQAVYSGVMGAWR